MKNEHYIIFNYDLDKLAGTERAIYNLVDYLSERKFTKTTVVLAHEPCDLAFDLPPTAADVVFLGKYKQERYSNILVSHLRHLVRLYRYLKNQNQSDQYIAITTNPLLALVMFLANSLLPKRCRAQITCEHFSITAAGKGTLLVRNFLYRYLYVTTLTENDCRIIDQKYHPRKTSCIPNATPFALKSYQDFKRNKSFLSIGRLISQKGFDLLITSFAKIAAKYPDWSLVIVGDDYGEKAELLRLISHYGLQKQITIEPATKNISNYYKQAAFYVLSSRFEGLPMVLLEAMSFGLPIASFNCPTGPKEVIDDSNGFLVDNGNTHQLSDAIGKLIFDESLRLQKASGSENKAKLFTKEHINAHWDKFLLHIKNDC